MSGVGQACLQFPRFACSTSALGTVPFERTTAELNGSSNAAGRYRVIVPFPSSIGGITVGSRALKKIAFGAGAFFLLTLGACDLLNDNSAQQNSGCEVTANAICVKALDSSSNQQPIRSAEILVQTCVF